MVSGGSWWFQLYLVVGRRVRIFFFCFGICFFWSWARFPHFFYVFHYFSLVFHWFSFIVPHFFLVFQYFSLVFHNFPHFFIVLHYFSLVFHHFPHIFLPSSIRKQEGGIGERAQCAPLDLNLQAAQLSVHRWTSTGDLPGSVCTPGPQPASCPAQCAPLDLNGQIECQKICQMECQIECQKICQIKCHEICQIECKKLCQIECLKICQ